MTSAFDGMTGILADVFGGLVAYLPQDGSSRDIQSIFRESPIEIPGADGNEVLIEAPTWRVRRDLVPELKRGDHITVADGRRFRVRTVHSNGSPSLDAHVICELHLDPEATP